MKITTFFFIGLAMLLTKTTVQAQINYTDVDPDSTIMAPLGVFESYFLDLDNDATDDFEIRHFYPDTMNAAIELYPMNGSEVIVWDSTSLADFPAALDSGAAITDTSNWSGSAFSFFLNSEAGNDGFWVDAVRKCLGLRFKISGQWHYGWCRLNVPANAASFTVIDYAYAADADVGVLAGSQSVATGIAKQNGENSALITYVRQGVLNIINQRYRLPSELIVRTVSGQTVKQMPLNEEHEIISLEDLPHGIYIISVAGQGKEGTRKVVW